MKVFFLFFSVVLFISQSDAFSQSFINGSFEIASDSCLENIPNGVIQSIIPGLYSFGDSRGVDFRSNTCPLPGSINPPKAREGSKYLAFGYDFAVNGSDSIALALTSPLTSGQTYRLNYSHRRDPGFTSPVYEIGCSNDSNRFGQLIGLGHCINFKYVWEDTSYTFTPKINCNYITLRNILNGEVLYLDNFTISTVSSVEEDATRHIKCFPNPFDDFTLVQLDNVNQPYEIQITNFVGKIMYSEKNINQDVVRINRGDIPSGVYILKVSDYKKSVYFSKIIIQ